MKSKKAPYFFIAPALILLFFFSILPIFIALIISFTDMSLAGLADYSRINFMGVENYTNILSDPSFRQSILNTIYYVIIGVPLVVALSMGIAILINMGKGKFFSFMRLIFYSPSITNIVAIAIVWSFLFNPSDSIGLFNRLLHTIGLGPIAWLQDPRIAKLSLIILAVWRGIGINMLIFSAALTNIPKTMYEAAELDGATQLQQIRYITIPQLKFSTFFVIVTTLIGWLQFFEEPFVMTEGGPLNSTLSVSLFIYRNGFQLNNFGYAAAGSLILFVVIIIATLFQMKIQRKEEENTI
ncbi:carbohydrate ABC transporter permease [Pisciglobus halotolerans]|uniref:Carbohydrate ABC transporter membrane protein 1, CUT1 family n=1 Tax=Pisciglobus halotolerans TaxID=745365 RepID=A0A1I3AVP0_9LACT|nr:sugar ABC transporter permease [Pisciglobus halotolerans]SFH53819.1 carbohydrate ABC transporter membrane protein 1, CUT1 family [Pisciglobus halotolerans]